jgi:hypothetical protein
MGVNPGDHSVFAGLVDTYPVGFNEAMGVLALIPTREPAKLFGPQRLRGLTCIDRQHRPIVEGQRVIEPAQKGIRADQLLDLRPGPVAIE